MGSLLGDVLNLRPRAKAWPTPPKSKYPNPFIRNNAGSMSQEMSAYGAVSTLFAVVSKIATGCSQADWSLYRVSSDARRTIAPQAPPPRTELVSHVAKNVWDNPNPFYSQQYFMESLIQHLKLTGEGCILVGRHPLASMPMELWPVRPDRITPIPDPETFLAGYVYTSPNGEKVPLGVDDLIHIKMPNPLDPYRGMGPVQALLVDLDSAKFSAQWNRNFFLNDATPGGVIEMEERLTDSEWTEFNERWREGHQGTSNAHRVAMLERAHWVNAQFTMRDMQFVELRDMSRDLILEAYGIHKAILGRADDVNRAAAEVAELTHNRWVLNPDLDRVKDALNHSLLPMFGSSGEGVEFDFEDMSLENSEAANQALTARSNAAKVLVEAGGKWESVLEAVGLPAIEFDAEKVARQEKADQERAAALSERNGQAAHAGQREPVPVG